jgi:type I restriction enzyme S subunit
MKTGINDSGLNLTHGRFKRLPVVLAPLPEQHRIVSAIESYFTRLDDAVATLERVQRNLKRYRASVLKAAVEGRLVPTEAELARAEGRSYEPASALLTRILAERRRRWEEAELAKMTAKGKAPKDDKWKAKYVEPVAPDTKMLGDLPDGWLWATVESIASKVVDGVHKKPSYVDEGVPFVTVKNLTAGPGISFGSLRYVTQNDHEKFIARANPERGDLLVSKDGTLGVIRAIRTDRVFSIFVSVALVKPILREISDYLEIAFSSPVMQVQMIPKGSGLQHIHLEDLRADCVPVPPLAEAERICFEVQRHISMIDELEREVSQNVTRCLRLRQSILKWAFEGRLVDQDPTDEPASVLLERIRAERASATDTTPRRARRTNPRAPKS